MEIPASIAGEVGRHCLPQLIERRQPIPRGGLSILNAKPIRGLLAAVTLALCAPASWSQESLTRAVGRITDAGKSLSGGTVILKNQETQQAYGTPTDKDGRFCTPELARGTYSIDILNAAGANVFNKTLQLTSAPRARIRLDIDISGTPAGAVSGAGAGPPASPPPTPKGSDSPAASAPACCTERWMLPLGAYSQGPPMGPYSPGGWAAAPFSAVEVVSTEPVPTHGTAIHPMGLSVKIYRDSHGRSRIEKPICSSLWKDAEEFLVSIEDPVAGYVYDLDPQNRITYRYSLKALKDLDSRYFSAPAGDGNRPGPPMEVTKEPLGSQMIEGVLAVGTRETRIIPGGAGDNRPPITLVMEVWYSPDIGAVVLQKSPIRLVGDLIRRLTKIDRAEPDISLFQPPADYKIEDATGPVTINYPNVEAPPAGPAQARPEATTEPQNHTAPAPKPGEVWENPKDGLKYVWIPPGTFMMGCSPGDNECPDRGVIVEKPAHQVTITKGFWIGQTVVTVGAYKRFTASTGRHMPPAPDFNSGWTNEKMPIVNISWDDAQPYCQWSAGRLPTEAEWEYAARAGSTEARYGPLDEVAWYSGNSGGHTHEVAQKRANGFGLYDTLGNVWEWVNDWYDARYYQNSPSQDPAGPSRGDGFRVMRGGSWFNGPEAVRVSFRFRLEPGSWVTYFGVRCVGEAKAALAGLLGSIRIHTTPGAAVLLDGVGKGTANPDGHVVITDVAAGDHDLHITARDKKDYRQSVSILAGQERKVDAVLADLPLLVSTVATVRENPKDGLKYVWIPPGTFQMGCSPGDSECFDHEKPAHQVTITKSFWMGQTEVTVGAYKRFAAATGQQMPPAPRFNSGWTNENMPIVNVTWNASKAYCQWSGGRLPTEAEWEYAARGGSTEARYGPLDDIAWYVDNTGFGTHDVAQKRANAFGLYDMLGNVWESVNDWYDENYYQNSPSQDPPGPRSGQYRVLRGGTWIGGPRVVRVSYRFVSDPGHMGDGDFGFRCVGEANIP